MSEKPSPEASIATDGRPRLTGWELVEDQFVRHDTSMVEGFNKDIDTLLVFAGLFSAVLSAFVVVSLSMLQQDNGQTSVNLLLHLSAQSANSSQPAATLPEFHPPASAVWINSLWLLSLILSVTSALFGMITKQWLREYMEWTTTSWMPQNTITLRQKRFEAFDEWKVPAIITTIPALLEVALILFFVGLAVFLWTFNVIVAGVSIAAITTSIALAVLATVLPVFYRRCPYKSPTGWACLRAMWLSAWAWERLRKNVLGPLSTYPTVRKLLEHLQVDFDEWKSWRARDSDTGGKDVAGTAAVDALGATNVCFSQRYPLVVRFDEATCRGLYNLAALDRAFAWIRETSQNEHLLKAVEQCAAARNGEGCPPLALVIFDFSVACRALNMEPETMCTYLDQLYSMILDGDEIKQVLFSPDWNSKIAPELLIQFGDPNSDHRLFRQVARALPHDLSRFLGSIDLIHFHKDETSARFLMRIAALCALTGWNSMDLDLKFTTCLAQRFRRQLQEEIRPLPGLPSAIFEILCLRPESIVEHREHPDIDVFGCLMITDPHIAFNVGFTRVALSLGGSILGIWFRDQADLFCRYSREAIQWTNWEEDSAQNSDATVAQLLAYMTKVADHVLSRGCQNCGSYPELFGAWLGPLYRLFDRRINKDRVDRQRMQPLFPHELIALIARYGTAGLLTSGQEYTLRKLLKLSRKLLSKTSSNRWEDSSSSYGLDALFGTDTPSLDEAPDAPMSGHPFEALSASSTPQRSSHQSASESSQHDITSTSRSVVTTDLYSGVSAPSAMLHPAPNEVTPTASFVTQAVADELSTPRDPQVNRSHKNSPSSIINDNIDLQNVGRTQRAQVQSPVNLGEQRTAMESSPTFSENH